MDYDLSTTWTIVLVLLAIWELTWKGFALWQAGRNNHRNWFIALMIINSVGILPMLYLLINYNRSGDSSKERYDGEATIPVKG